VPAWKWLNAWMTVRCNWTHACVGENVSWTYCVPRVKGLQKIIVHKKSAKPEKMNQCSEVKRNKTLLTVFLSF
jgi:hypothetical protein